MAAIDSSSSCGPHAKAHPPPPMAHAPTPMAVSSRSLLPRRFFCISSTITNVGTWSEQDGGGDRFGSERTRGGDSAGARRVRGDGPRGGGDDRRRNAVGGAGAAGIRPRRLFGGPSDGGDVAVLRAVPVEGIRTGVDPPRGAARAPARRRRGGDAGAIDRRDRGGVGRGRRAVA